MARIVVAVPTPGVFQRPPAPRARRSAACPETEVPNHLSSNAHVTFLLCLFAGRQILLFWPHGHCWRGGVQFREGGGLRDDDDDDNGR